jgi:urease gamma subunit
MNALSEEQVMDGVADIVTQIRVEVLLEEGSRLIVLLHPLGSGSRTTPSISPVGERA